MPEPIFQLHQSSDQTAGVTGFRREIKFASSGGDLRKIRGILEVNCRRIIYNRDSSLVSSIYFDDCSLSSCRESIDGVAKRNKLRLRWYDEGDAEGRFFFEVKRRVGLAIEKWRAMVESSAPLQSLSFSDLLRELLRILPAAQRELLRARSEPILMTRYRREHFKALDSPVRITLDSDIMCYDQSAATRTNQRFGVSIPDLLVIEGKAPPANELDLPGLFHPLKPRMTKSSKYVLGCQKLGLLSATALGHQ